ncbi:unnamed protein product [marine sediment metagenome]|uniref:Uncharacterized protein n=1 Tax=marine sediment metagenome TaxID=412755 RepID=X0S267_9ZZZZ
MDESGDRPDTSAHAPQVDGLSEARLVGLLLVEEGRLVVARRIEEERNIVFPETTVIIKDIQTIAKALDAVRQGRTSVDDDAAADLEALLVEIEEV